MLCESFLVVHWSRLARPERPLSSTRISDWLTADRDERLAGVASRGQILINRKLIVRFVRLSLATIDVIRKRMNVGESLLAATAKKTAKRQAAECREGKKGRAVGRRWRTWKELEPWGLHCCSAGDYDWQANSFSFFFFAASSPSGSAQSRCPQGPVSCYHPGLVSGSLSIVPFPTICLIASLKPRS